MSFCGFVIKSGKQIVIKTLEHREITIDNIHKHQCLYGDAFKQDDDQNQLIMIGNSRQYFNNFIRTNYENPDIIQQEIEKHQELITTSNLIEHFNISACDYVNRGKIDEYFGHLKNITYLYYKWYNLSIIRGFKLLGLKKDEIDIIKRYNYPHTIYIRLLKSPWQFVFLSPETQIRLSRLLRPKPRDIDLVSLNLFVNLYHKLNIKGRIKYRNFKPQYPNIEFMHQYFNDFGVVYDGNYLSFDFIKDIHNQIDNRLRKIAKSHHPPLAFSDLLDIKLSDRQRESIKLVAQNGVSCILGPAGTGKTTIINTLICMLRRFNYNPLLISYTGKACRRLEEVCEIPAKTLHQCIYNHDLKSHDAIIFDEIGMIPSYLMLRLLYKIHDDTRVIMVGDFNQLPPIKDYSISHILRLFPRVVLNECLRSNDDLFKNCQAIYQQDNIKFELNEHFNYHKVNDTEDIMELIKKNTESDFKIITPYLDTATELINDLDNTKTGLYITDAWKHKWYLGEKVMFIYNNYQMGIMNSDEGIITSLTPLKICFNDTEYEFETTGYKYISTYDDDITNKIGKLNTSMIIKSSVITIHKAQGSEWNEVWFYIPKLTRFINRRLVYTALTRARNRCLILSPFSLDKICKYIK